MPVAVGRRITDLLFVGEEVKPLSILQAADEGENGESFLCHGYRPKPAVLNNVHR